MIYFIQFIQDPRKTLFTFTHPVTPQKVLEKIRGEANDTHLSYLKQEKKVISNTQIEFKNYTFQVWEVSLNSNKQMKIVALYDKQDSSQLVSNIINDSLTPHIRARLIKDIQKGFISVKTKNLLRDRFLKRINEKIDPLSRRWQRKTWKKMLTLIGGVSLSSLFFTIKLLIPHLYTFFDTFHLFVCFSLMSGLIGYLSHKNKGILKSSFLLLTSTFSSYIIIKLVRSRLNFSPIKILPLLLYGCFLFLVSNLTLVLVNRHYLVPPH